MSANLERSSRRFAFAIPLALCAVIAAGCGKDEDLLLDPEVGPAQLEVVSGDDQTGVVGMPLPSPVILQVTDAMGGAVANQPVEIQPSGKGRVSTSVATTDLDGRLTVAWTLDTVAGPNTLTVTVSGLAPLVVDAVGEADAPAAARAIGSVERLGIAGRAVAESLAVRVTDRYGNPISDIVVAWAATAGGGVVSPATTVTDSTGRAAALWTLGAEGPNAATATAGSLDPVRFSAAARSAIAGLDLGVQVVATGLHSPLFLTAPAGDTRLFVVEQTGRVHIIQNGQLLPTPFLDIASKVVTGSEVGLLGLAFHPRYSENGFFYASYVDTRVASRVERYRVSSDPNRADHGSAATVLVVQQPFENHNGGMVAFGPDSMLYVALGDGGGAYDPLRSGQDSSTLLGKLLRIDVDRGSPYTVPATNPFVNTPGAKPEIWALGLRNPWRFAFDRPGGMLYIADVGQQSWEEVNVVPASLGGVNYGWSRMEGSKCLEPTPCTGAGLTLPVEEYGHGDGCSITGGFVYRGTQIPEVQGHYFYSDYCAGFLRSFRFADGRATERRDWGLSLGSVLSFGEDASGELYVLTGDGRVLKLVRGS